VFPARLETCRRGTSGGVQPERRRRVAQSAERQDPEGYASKKSFFLRRRSIGPCSHSLPPAEFFFHGPPPADRLLTFVPRPCPIGMAFSVFPGHRAALGPGSLYRAFGVNRAAAILQAVAEDLIVNIQPGVIRRLLRESLWCL
jgi:hypothetical protein